MADAKEKHDVFPNYLRARDPSLNDNLLKWIGDFLKNSRSKKSVDTVAKASDVTPKEIEELEGGVIRQNLGKLRFILQQGYGRKFEDVLSKCYEAFKTELNPHHKRLFKRDFYYSVCIHEGEPKPTPMLFGGDPESFIWAIPFRKLDRQPLSVEYLELAPNRKKKSSGMTPGNSHDGVEVVQVIYGTVSVSIETNQDDPPVRTLKPRDCIHFHGKQVHVISNTGNTNTALLLIVRLPELTLVK